jgi:hypothetical protein
MNTDGDAVWHGQRRAERSAFPCALRKRVRRVGGALVVGSADGHLGRRLLDTQDRVKAAVGQVEAADAKGELSAAFSQAPACDALPNL